MLGLTPLFLLAFALLVALLKGRYLFAAITLGAWVGLTLIADAAIGTAVAADAPFGDAWLVVLLQLAGWVPSPLAACGEATPGSWWAKSGRQPGATPVLEVLANFIWVFSIILLGIAFAGVDILGAEIFCALFATLLAGVLLFGFGAARVRTA